MATLKKMQKRIANNSLKNRMEVELINLVMREFKKGIKDDTISRAAVLGPTDNSLDVWVLCLLGHKRPYKATVFVENEQVMIEYIEH